MQNTQLKVCWAVCAGGSVFVKLHHHEHHRDLLVVAAGAWNLGSSEEMVSAGSCWMLGRSGGSLRVSRRKRETKGRRGRASAIGRVRNLGRG